MANGHGGVRPGAGRPKQHSPKEPTISLPTDASAVDYALAVMRDPQASTTRRDRFALALLNLQRTNVKKGGLGKKELAKLEAEQIPEEWECLVRG